MLLLRTDCSTDWKGRPSHHVSLVAKTESREDAIAAMNADVHRWMAFEIALYESCESDTDTDVAAAEEKRAGELAETKTSAELLAMWRHADRFELQLYESDHREFVECMDGDFITTVYHLLEDDHSYTDRN